MESTLLKAFAKVMVPVCATGSVIGIGKLAALDCAPSAVENGASSSAETTIDTIPNFLICRKVITKPLQSNPTHKNP
jgi:hypothetical protein